MRPPAADPGFVLDQYEAVRREALAARAELTRVLAGMVLACAPAQEEGVCTARTR